MKITPLIIEIVLFYYTTGSGDFENLDAPAVKEAVVYLLDNHILGIKANDPHQIYTTTCKGQAWVEMLCETPFPVSKWVRP